MIKYNTYTAPVEGGSELGITCSVEPSKILQVNINVGYLHASLVRHGFRF